MSDLGPWIDSEEPPPDTDVPPDIDALDDAYEQAAARTRRVAHEADRLRIHDLARRQVAKERQAERPIPKLINLVDFLAEEDDRPVYRIDRLWPSGGRVLIPAQFKAGKTSLVANIIRSLVDGTPFLDTFAVDPAHRIVLIDDELDPGVLRRWLRDQQIVNQNAVELVPLRGNVGAFDILDDEWMAHWVKILTGADVVIIDCLRPILDALGLDENHDVGRFLVALDTLLGDAGCSESAVIHHMGHSGERSRGDSRLNDWPDAIWKLVRDKDEENPDLDDVTGARYFSAYGRDVEHPQSELTYDPETRHLSLGEHAPNRLVATIRRREAKAEQAVWKAVEAKPGITRNGIRKAAKAHGVANHPAIDAAIDTLIELGHIGRVVSGRSHLHYPTGHLLNGTDQPGEPNEPTMSPDRSGSPGVIGEPTTFREWAHPSTSPQEPLHEPTLLDEPPATPTKPCPGYEGHECGDETPANQTRCRPCTYGFIESRRSPA